MSTKRKSEPYTDLVSLADVHNIKLSLRFPNCLFPLIQQRSLLLSRSSACLQHHIFDSCWLRWVPCILVARSCLQKASAAISWLVSCCLHFSTPHWFLLRSTKPPDKSLRQPSYMPEKIKNIKVGYKEAAVAFPFMGFSHEVKYQGEVHLLK